VYRWGLGEGRTKRLRIERRYLDACWEAYT